MPPTPRLGALGLTGHRPRPQVLPALVNSLEYGGGSAKALEPLLKIAQVHALAARPLVLPAKNRHVREYDGLARGLSP